VCLLAAYWDGLPWVVSAESSVGRLSRQSVRHDVGTVGRGALAGFRSASKALEGELVLNGALSKVQSGGQGDCAAVCCWPCSPDRRNLALGGVVVGVVISMTDDDGRGG
jgi:hypothetical protein